MNKITSTTMLKAIDKHQKVQRLKKGRGKKNHFKNYSILRQFILEIGKEYFNINEFGFWLSNNSVYEHKRLDVLKTAREVTYFTKEKIKGKEIVHMKKSDYKHYFIDEDHPAIHTKKTSNTESALVHTNIFLIILQYIRNMYQNLLKTSKKVLTSVGQV